MTLKKLHYTLQFRLLVVLIVIVSLVLIHAVISVSALQLRDRELMISSSSPNAVANYEFSYNTGNLGLIQTVRFQFCANDPLIDTACVTPTGLDVSNANLTAQSGDIGFSIDPRTSANELIISRPPFSSGGQLSTYSFNNIKNPSDEASYYVRIQTFEDSDLTNPANNYGGLAYAITQEINVTAVVPPYLLFCVGVTVNGMDCDNVVGNYVDFGEFSSRQASRGSTQMLAATNAIGGYGLWLSGIPLTSGTNIIPGLVGADVSRPGTSQFGLNLRANSSPQGGSDVLGSGVGQPTNGYNQPNFYRFNSGDMVAASPKPDYARKYTSSYMVNVAKGQSPGVYVSTLTYIALGSF
jgi:hypothetical protein